MKLLMLPVAILRLEFWHIWASCSTFTTHLSGGSHGNSGWNRKWLRIFAACNSPVDGKPISPRWHGWRCVKVFHLWRRARFCQHAAPCLGELKC